MNGMPHPGSLQAPVDPLPHLGILYAEDFDDLPFSAASEPLVEAFSAGLTQADLNVACDIAVQQAQALWEASQLQLRTQALVSIAAGIAEMRAEARQETAAIAEETVGTMLAMLAGALPNLCKTHGDAEVRALMRHLLPALQRDAGVVVRVHPALAPTLLRDIALMDEDLAETITVTPYALPQGDVRVTWTDGSFTRNTGQILAAMQDVLAQLGLLEPITKRRMALAE